MSTFISTIGMSHIDWLRARQRGLGGSDVPAICGEDGFKTRLAVYNDKVAENTIEIEDNASMRAGRKLENTICDWWAEDNEFKIQADNKIRVHSDYPFLLANLDRVIVANGHGRGTGVLEAKLTSQFYFKTWEEALPLQYYFQVQHYLNITGFDWAAVAVLVDGKHLHSIDIEPDKEVIDTITEKLVAFWEDHVLKRIPPEPSTDEEIRNKWPEAEKGKILEVDAATVDTIIEANGEASTRRTAEKIEKELKTEIRLKFGDHDIMTYNGQTVATYKNAKPTIGFDELRFRADHPKLWREFMQPETQIIETFHLDKFIQAHSDIYNQYLTQTPGSRRLLLKAK